MPLTGASRTLDGRPAVTRPRAWLAGGLVGLVGCLVLAGWVLDAAILTSAVPSLGAMNPLTAVAFLLIGISLWLAHDDRAGQARPPMFRRVAGAAAGLVALLGLLTLAGYGFGRNLGLDQILFADQLAGNRIAPNTGINLFLAGVSLLLLIGAGRRGQHLAQGLALASVLVALFAVVGDIYGASSLTGFAAYTPMPLTTALAFIVLDVGLIAARPGAGLAALITSETVGGVVLRRLLPAAVGTPIVLGWLRLQGQRVGLYDTEFGTAVSAVANAGVFAALILGLAWTLHRTDAERRSAEEERDSFFRLSRDLLCIAGLDGFFKRLNPAFSRVLGFTEAQLLAEPFLTFVHPDDRATTLAEVRRLASGEPTVGFENRYRCRDGSYRWFDWSVSPADDRLYAVAHDVTGRKQAAEALQAANRELEDFAYSVSHDLRAPLLSLQGMAGILLEDHAADLPDEARGYLDRIVANADKMQALIGDLLDLARVGRAEDDRAPVDLGAVVRDVAEQLGHTLAARGAAVRIAGELPTVWANRARLAQLFANLIDNAVAYTPADRAPLVQLGAVERPDCWEITVRDNGVGIPAAWQEKVFRLFQRLPVGKALNPGGTGVGLAIVARIVETHGGRLWLESVEGAGTTFHLALPKQHADVGGGTASSGSALIRIPGAAAA